MRLYYRVISFSKSTLVVASRALGGGGLLEPRARPCGLLALEGLIVTSLRARARFVFFEGRMHFATLAKNRPALGEVLGNLAIAARELVHNFERAACGDAGVMKRAARLDAAEIAAVTACRKFVDLEEAACDVLAVARIAAGFERAEAARMAGDFLEKVGPEVDFVFELSVIRAKIFEIELAPFGEKDALDFAVEEFRAEGRPVGEGFDFSAASEFGVFFNGGFGRNLQGFFSGDRADGLLEAVARERSETENGGAECEKKEMPRGHAVMKCKAKTMILHENLLDGIFYFKEINNLRRKKNRSAQTGVDGRLKCSCG